MLGRDDADSCPLRDTGLIAHELDRYHSGVSDTRADITIPAEVLTAFALQPDSVERLHGGHINTTFRATRADGRRCILQRVSPIFPPAVNIDIDAITRHLAARDLTTPVLLSAADGRNWAEVGDDVWRLLSFVDGHSTETIAQRAEATEAGRLLGRFHSALDDLDHEFQSVRSDPHDTARHLRGLDEALGTHRTHPSHDAVARVAASIFDAADAVALIPAGPARVVHGDPKISNLMFDRNTGEGLCLVDLDTCGRRSVATELGDAFRSWCNPSGEDHADATFSLELFAAAVEGYASAAGTLLTAQESGAIPDAVCIIGVELAARFCADALNERFFGWDRARFPSAHAHNLARAEAQLQVARAALQQRESMTRIVRDTFSRGSSE